MIVFVDGGSLKVDSHDVGKRSEPSDHVGELFLGGFSVVSFLELFSQFLDFVDEPVVGSLHSSFAVSLQV